MNVTVSKEVSVTAEWKVMDLLWLLTMSDLDHAHSVIFPLCSAIFSP